MYTGLKHLHNLIFWIIFLSGLWANFRTWRGHLTETPWTRRERIAGLVFSMSLATQLLIGLILYFNSPIVHSLMTGVAAGPERVKAVFFALLHPLVMFTAVVFSQVGYSVSKRLRDDRAKYRVAAMCYTAALVVLLTAVPWPFLSYGRSLIP
jgi:cytochrome c biogenesis factor